MPWACLNVTFWDIQPARLIDSMRLREGFLWDLGGFSGISSPRWDKSWFCPRSNTHIALLQSSPGSFMRNLKSCFKVIQRTLWSGNNCLRYSSFCAISRVEWKRDTTFEHFKTLQPTLAKHDNVSKKQFEVRNGMTCRGCASQKVF